MARPSDRSMPRRTNVNKLSWCAEANPNPEAALEGADAFTAWPEELIAARQWGPSMEEAVSASKVAARRILDKLTPDQLRLTFLPMAQLNIRIKASQKASIVRRADEEGKTLTRFVLERCLAPPGRRRPVQ